MATTTNFGWETPDDTDLVKDGASAMRTLGNSIDTSFVDLKGGTTGQFLSKASNTDLDFTWGAALTNPLTTTGDIIYSSSGSTAARRAIGTTGQVLTVSGGVPTWVTPSGAGLNYTLLNSGDTSVGTSTSKTWSSINGYDNYVIYVQSVLCVGTGASITAQWNADATNGNHLLIQSVFNKFASDNVLIQTSYSSTDGFILGRDQSDDTSDVDTISSYIEMLGVGKSTGIKPFKSWGSGGNVANKVGQRFYQNGGRFIASSAISSFKISTPNGFTSGDVYIYGA